MKAYLVGIWMSCIFGLSGCMGKDPKIQALCVRDEVGNYIIKWEIQPQLDGLARIYVSDTPGHFNMDNPIGYTSIREGVKTYITQDNLKRKYFRITFNDKYPQDLAAHYSMMDNIQNFRDFGGYKTSNGSQIQWGMIYRSGNIQKYSKQDSLRIAGVEIKTVIDLRSPEEIVKAPVNFPGVQVVNIPVEMTSHNEFLQRVFEDKVRKWDGMLYMEDKYISFVREHTGSYSKALHLFLDKRNYPILIQGELGKDRVGFLSAVLLSVLGVPHETVMEDYLDSNRYINPNFMSPSVCKLSSDAQETMTVLLSVQESFLNISWSEIDRQYNSFSNYVEEGLSLSPKNQEKLRDILLK